MIAIPNMDMTKSCTECPFEVIGISGYPRCVIVQEMVVDGNLFNRCPLIDIVRCGECKWSYTAERDGTLWCKVHMSHYRVIADHFCKYGERRADEN